MTSKKVSKKVSKKYGGSVDPALLSLAFSIVMKLVQNPDIIADVVALFRKKKMTTQEMETALARLLAKQAADIDNL
jgi:hypothetical protein